MKTELVKDWMTPDPVCVSPQTTLPEALELMHKRHIRRLPVVSNGKLAGIVTYGDLRGAQPSEATSLSVYEVTYLLNKVTLERLMAKNVVTVTPQTTVGEAAKLMLRHKIAGLPVIEDGQVVGILTESDIFRMVASNWEKEEAPTPALTL